MSNPLNDPAVWDLTADAYGEVVVPMFRAFSRAAIDTLELRPGDRLLDVACGPGTAAIVAAKRGIHVDAVDFSPQMLAQLRARLPEHLPADLVDRVCPAEMDGQALTFQDGAFQGAMSMFGLMFFPDRAAGFGELFRVLRPGGRVAVSSWVPVEASPFASLMFGAIATVAPERPGGGGSDDAEAPPRDLSDPEAFAAELAAAGFQDVTVDRVSITWEVPDWPSFWEAAMKSSPPMLMLRERMGADAFEQRSSLGLAYLEANGPATPTALPMHAWLGTGRKPR